MSDYHPFAESIEEGDVHRRYHHSSHGMPATATDGRRVVISSHELDTHIRLDDVDMPTRRAPRLETEIGTYHPYSLQIERKYGWHLDVLRARVLVMGPRGGYVDWEVDWSNMIVDYSGIERSFGRAVRIEQHPLRDAPQWIRDMILIHAGCDMWTHPQQRE